MGSLSDSTVVEATQTSLATTIDGEAVILERESGMYYGLNEVATYIWESLEQPQTVSDLRENVLSAYDVSLERCDRDLETVLAEMEEYGLIEIEEQ